MLMTFYDVRAGQGGYRLSLMAKSVNETDVTKLVVASHLFGTILNLHIPSGKIALTDTSETGL